MDDRRYIKTQLPERNLLIPQPTYRSSANALLLLRVHRFGRVTPIQAASASHLADDDGRSASRDEVDLKSSDTHIAGQKMEASCYELLGH